MSSDHRRPAPSAPGARRSAKSQVVDELSECVVALHDPSITDVEREQWKAWIDADPSRKIEFDRMSSLWNIASELSGNSRPSDSDIASDLYDPAWPVPLPPPYSSALESFRWPRRHIVSVACATLVVLLAVAALFVLHSNAGQTTEYATRVAEDREIDLADGSKVWLGAASRLAVTLGKAKRTTTLLAGEALFAVSHDATRQFIVRVGGGEVRVLGTVFAVHKGTEAADVAVKEGVVGIVPSGSNGAVALQLRRGFAVTFGKTVGPVRLVAAGSVGSFLTRRLEYINTPLREVMSDLRRYSKTPIMLDPNAAALPFTGTVRLDQIPEWLTAFARAYDLEIVSSSEQTVLKIRR